MDEAGHGQHFPSLVRFHVIDHQADKVLAVNLILLIVEIIFDIVISRGIVHLYARL